MAAVAVTVVVAPSLWSRPCVVAQAHSKRPCHPRAAAASNRVPQLHQHSKSQPGLALGVGCGLASAVSMLAAPAPAFAESITAPLLQAFSVGFLPLNDARPRVAAAGCLERLLACGHLQCVTHASMPASVAPQYLFVWALKTNNGAIKRANLAYWQACSLFMITVYLEITGWAPAFITEVASVLLTPIALWWYKDLNEDIKEGARAGLSLNTSWQVWRVVSTASMLWIAATQLATNTSCALVPSGVAVLSQNPTCAAWLEPVYYYNQLLHPSLDTSIVRPVGLFSLGVYVCRWLQLLLLEIPFCGRSTYSNKRSASVKLARALGFLNETD
eukprot:jgi/Chlat1/8716/Chrsp9S08554